MKPSWSFFGFQPRIGVWAAILVLVAGRVFGNNERDLDQARIVPPTGIAKLPGPRDMADKLYKQLPAEDRKGLEALAEGMRQGDSIFQYGNWYGPGWWGGGDDPDNPGGKPPVDELDAAAQRHDYGYLVAERMGKIYGKAEEFRLKAIADAIAVEDAKRLDPDPSKWNPPAGDPEKASRYRDRIITGFTYESKGYDALDKAGKGLNWVTSPVESWEMSDHNQKLEREDFERHVDRFVNHWTRTNPTPPAENDDSAADDTATSTEAAPEASASDGPDTAEPPGETGKPSEAGNTAGESGKPDSANPPGHGSNPLSAPGDSPETAPPGTEKPPSETGGDGTRTSGTPPSGDEAAPPTPAGNDTGPETPEKAKDDGMRQGPPGGDESDAYDPGARVTDDSGVEYEKTDDGWKDTGDRYEPLTQKQKDAWDQEIQDAADNLKNEEAAPEWSDSSDKDSSAPPPNILDEYADGWQQEQKQKTDTSADNMDLTQRIQDGSTAGDQQIYDAKKSASAAGRDAQEIKDASAAKTAQEQKDQGWGKTLGDAVSDGIQTGLEDFASTFGSAAADEATRKIFDDFGKKEGKKAHGGKGGHAPGGSPASGGKVSSGGAAGASAGGPGPGTSPAGAQPASGGDATATATGDASTTTAEAGNGEEDFTSSGSSVTVTQDGAAGDGGAQGTGSEDAGSSGSGGFQKGAQTRVIDASAQLAGKTVAGVSVALNYNALTIPDSFEILYEGASLGNTGMVSHTGTLNGKGAGTSPRVTISVLSHQTNTGTRWNWTAKVTFHTKE